MSEEKKLTGAENVHWDLSILYSGIDDPQIDADIERLVEMQKSFSATHKGNLKTTLGTAIRDYSEIRMLETKISIYLHLAKSTDLGNATIQAKNAKAQKILSASGGEYLAFINNEIADLDDAVIQKFLSEDQLVAKHKPWLEVIRQNKPHLLSTEVESALDKREPFGPDSWAEFYEEVEADLRCKFRGEELTLSETLNILTTDKDPDRRADALKAANDSFRGNFAKFSAQTLYMVSGAKSVEDKERKYPHPMTARNNGNRIPDATVEALHQAVTEVAGPICRRYYRLKAALLGKEKLLWSDRNAPLPIADTSVIPFDEALDMVIDAYRSFSPTLADLISEMRAKRRIDVPPAKGKASGAFNYPAILPGNIPATFNLLNYFGSSGDVSTLAHELGHAGHGMLAGAAQGPLMYRAPIAYAETASIFGEMTTAKFLRARLLQAGDKKNLLAFLADKLDHMMNCVVRQISFSNFERYLHGCGKKLSAEELCDVWMNVTYPFYGADGEIFIYRDMNYLWAYIDHFHRPFYVYGYACGELLTQSLYAKFGDGDPDFEPRYLEMLRAGGTKDAVALLQPFGLDPTDPEFWAGGIRLSMGKMLEEAETLARELGYNVP